MRIALLVCLLARAPLRAQSTPSPEQASSALAQTIRELSSPSAEKMIAGMGDYKKAQQERLKRDLARRDDKKTLEPLGFNLGRDYQQDPLYRNSLRFSVDSLDINVLRPASRWTVGVGAAEHTMNDHGITFYDRIDGYGFVKLQLGGPRDEKKSKVLMPPTATLTETELGPNKVRVQRDEFTRGLKELKP